MRKLTMGIALAVAAMAILQNFAVEKVSAQQALTEDQKASIIFDLRLKMLREGKFLKSIGVDEMLEKVTPSMTEGIDLTKVDRIFGAGNLPQDMEVFAAGEMPRGNLPFNFFVRLQFGDSDTADELYAKMQEGSGSEEINGKTYLTPPDGADEGKNVVIHMADAKTIEIGTREFIFQPNRRLFKSGLASAWGKAPNHSLRIVFDVDGERNLVNEAVAMAKQQAPDPAKGFFAMVDMAKNLRISIDLDAEDLLVIAATGVDEDKAEELRGGLDALLALGKMTGGGAADGIPDPDAGKLAKEVIESLKATRQGAEVMIAIPRPSGLDETAKKFAEEAKGFLEEGPFGGSTPGFDPSEFEEAEFEEAELQNIRDAADRAKEAAKKVRDEFPE